MIRRAHIFLVFLIVAVASSGQSTGREVYLKGVLAVKLRDAPAANARQGFDFSKIPGYVSARAVKKRTGKARKGPSVLDGLYVIETSSGQSITDMCTTLQKDPKVIYATPIPDYQPLYQPSDPSAQVTDGQQDYLSVIRAYEAWDVTTGSEEVSIAIIDTGMELDHEDLAGKYRENEVESLNGLDDDGNGYVDDIVGYDFADDDTDANADGSQHGTHVGGIAGAMTDNGLGIAGVGFQTQLVPLKGFTTEGTLGTGLWEAVLYAADNGVDVLNLSWGGTGDPNPFYQDIIDYCVLERDAIVVAAAGNTPEDLDFYPASYDNVLSVGATDFNDIKWSNATYSRHIDLMAPGQNIFSTQNDDSYNSDSGSSHAAPQVAGVAALVKDVFPNYNARQIMEQIRVTTDDIYDISENSAYSYRLGKGRLNAFRAVTETNRRSVRVDSLRTENPFGRYAFPGDTVSLIMEFINFLAPVANPDVELISESAYAVALDDKVSLPALGTLGTHNDTLHLVLSEDTPPNTDIDFRLMISEGSYSDFQNLSFQTSPDAFTFNNELFSALVEGNGNFAFDEDVYFNEQPVLRYGGLMMGTSAEMLYDNVINSYENHTKEQDFQVDETFRLLRHENQPFVGYSRFRTNDDNFLVEQRILHDPSDAVLVMVYDLINTSGNDQPDMLTGFYADMMLPDALANKASWDDALGALVFKNKGETYFAALALDEGTGYAALDLGSENGNMADLGPAITDQNKFDVMNGANVAVAGENGDGNDVAGLVSTSVSLDDGERHTLVVYLVFAENLTTLTENLNAARNRYQDFLDKPQIAERTFTCENTFTYNPSSGNQFAFYEDPRGEVFLSEGEEITLTDIAKDTLIYVQNLDGTYASRIQAHEISYIDQIADFQPSKDTLYLDEPVNTVQFEDQSFEPITWQWNFGNGVQSTQQHPVVHYDTPGTYTVTLTVENQTGCVGMTTREIVVAHRPDAPNLTHVQACNNETVILEHADDPYFVVDGSGQQIAKGTHLELGPFGQDTTLQVGQEIDGFKSKTVGWMVSVYPVDAQFQMTPDTTTVAHQVIFAYTGSRAETFLWEVNDVFTSDDSSFSYPANDETLNVSLEVNNANCEILEENVFTISSSLKPIVQDQTVCPGEQVTISPLNGIYFAFYADEAMSQLLKKGQSLTIEDIQQDETIYIVGLDNGLPGPASSLTLTVDNPSITIQAEPREIILPDEQPVTFSLNTAVENIAWYIDGELFETDDQPTILITKAGTYEIEAKGTTTEGCHFSSLLSYRVLNPVSAQTSQPIKVFPNPTSDHITILGRVSHLDILSLNGQKIRTMQTPNQVDLSSLKTGVYLLRLYTREGITLRKLIIR